MKPWWKELVETLIWALVLALVLRTFVVQAFWIPSGSMIPTLMPGDRVLVAKFWYHFTEPKRGQVVVFKYPMDPTRDFVKRLIALPGETIEIKNGVVYINDSPLEEPYVKNRDFLSMEKVTVPRGQYFMMGDNRPNSQDSRFWGFVPKNYLRGRPFSAIGP